MPRWLPRSVLAPTYANNKTGRQARTHVKRATIACHQLTGHFAIAAIPEFPLPPMKRHTHYNEKAER